ncbi:hypothetical protein F442_22206, partial [Phytophthora nicotianae P10297]
VVLCEALEGHGKALLVAVLALILEAVWAPRVVVLVPIVEALLAQLVVAVLMPFVVDEVALFVEGVQVLSVAAKESMYHVPKQSQALKIMKLLAKVGGVAVVLKPFVADYVVLLLFGGVDEGGQGRHAVYGVRALRFGVGFGIVGSEIVVATRRGGNVTSGVVNGEGGVGDTAHGDRAGT